jgi:hypothetical protein
MVLYLCALIVFSLRRESLKLILATNPSPRWLCHKDAIQGADQAKSTYWSRVHQYFYANKTFDFDQSQVSVMNRWYDIQHDINVFAGCVAKIEARNQSGCSMDDKVCRMHLLVSCFIAE